MADGNSKSKLFFTVLMLLILSLSGCGKTTDQVIAWEEDYFVTTIHAKIRDDMPEFTFDIQAYLDRSTEVYHAETLTISDGAVFQTISLPELSLFGQTNIWPSMKDTMGFELEDVNFDGYQDIRLFDTTNGNYRQEWIYLVWNPEKSLFENDERLNHISLATFDQEKKLIYGMERGSAVDHSYFTYQYIDGEPVLIQKDTEEGVYREDEQIREYLSMGSVETDVTMFMMFHVTSSERNPDTGEMETIKEEYVIYPASDIISEGMELLRVDVTSEIGQAIFQD